MNIACARRSVQNKIIESPPIDISYQLLQGIAGQAVLGLTKNPIESNLMPYFSTGTFTYENRELDYSIRKYIEYTGEEQQVTVYWNVEEFLYPGTYRFDIFAEGTLIGSEEYSIKK